MPASKPLLLAFSLLLAASAWSLTAQAQAQPDHAHTHLNLGVGVALAGVSLGEGGLRTGTLGGLGGLGAGGALGAGGGLGGLGGLGGGLGRLGGLASAQGASLYVPIFLNPSLRLEPAVNLARASSDRTLDGVNFSSTALSVGAELGVLYNAPIARHTLLYGGPRLGVQRSQTDLSTRLGDVPFDTTSTTTQLTAAAVLGAERFFTDAFSLGAEIQLRYAHTRRENTSTSGDTTTSSESSADPVHTSARVFLRWYVL